MDHEPVPVLIGPADREVQRGVQIVDPAVTPDQGRRQIVGLTPRSTTFTR